LWYSELRLEYFYLLGYASGCFTGVGFYVSLLK